MIRTERLILRPIQPRDLAPFTAFYATERARYNGGPLEPGRAWRAFAAHLGAWELNGFGMFAYTIAGEERTLGLAGPWFPGDWPEREIGWNLFDPADEGRGYASEAARAAIDHALGPLGWETAVSYIHADNARSRALARRLGAVCDPGAVRPPAPPGTPIEVWRHPNPNRRL